MKKLYIVFVVVGAIVGGSLSLSQFATASDHDDGESNLKGRALNLTDLFVFREGDQSGSTADNSNLIFIMNSNPRSLPGQQYYFSNTARYEFHITRVLTANKAVTPTGADDAILRFEFGAPDSNNQQALTLTSIRAGVGTHSATTNSAGAAILTTPIGTAAISHTVSLGGTDLTIFAGHREDPFFFDVNWFFQVRANLANSSGTSIGSTAKTTDFAKNYNVNSIVARVPITFLQTSTDQTVFDVWETISIPN